MEGQEDSAFDGCECVWSHEFATRRLIDMIRQTQDYCTDNECLTQGQGGAGSSEADSMGMFFVGFWFLFAAVLFFLRPRRTTSEGKGHEPAGPTNDRRMPPPTAS